MKHNLLIILLFSSILLGCNKDFLDIKRQQTLIIPTTIADYQGLIDNRTIINNDACNELGIIGADEYSISDAVWNVLSAPYQKNGYVWAKDVYQGEQPGDWNNAYWRILYANTALDGALKIKPETAEKQAWNNLKGSALFLRAYNFYQLAQEFCKPYNQKTANNDAGIPLRLEADIDLVSSRATVAETYKRILDDLLIAVELLPDLPLVKFRPAKTSAFALLAKTYLLMGDYTRAGYYADLCLKIKSELIDFKTLTRTARYPFPTDYEQNKEVLFATGIANITITATTRINILPEILDSYTYGDLRAEAYFFNNTDGRILFKGSYKGGASFFTGLATDEVWLIRAECFARKGNKEQALADLNTLRKHRFSETAYQALTASDSSEALRLIIEERKKELLLRGTRWEDLRRLNKESSFAKTLKRTVMNVAHELLPEDNKYVWPIPENEIIISGIMQNPR